MFNPLQYLKRLGSLPKQINQQSVLIDALTTLIKKQTEDLSDISSLLRVQSQELVQLESHFNKLEQSQTQQLTQLGSQLTNIREDWQKGFPASQLTMLSPRLRRNFLPNDFAALQKHLLATWRASSTSIISHRDLLESGFRVFSQNDEDGILLRIFSHIGRTNQYVIEIGSNCSDSDLGIPENLSANLIVNHGWHGAIFEMDQTECERMRYFFARDYATKHFHVSNNNQNGYFSPLIIQQAISPENINQVLQEAHDESEPDLMIIDIDGGDYEAMRRMSTIRPRVLVVEFEKRFRDRHSVVQFDNTQFSRNWAQSGAASLPAWEKLLSDRGYAMIAIGTCGFNAFFVRSDIATGKFAPLKSREAFDSHPILSKVQEDFWLTPDETWQPV